MLKFVIRNISNHRSGHPSLTVARQSIVWFVLDFCGEKCSFQLLVHFKLGN